MISQQNNKFKKIEASDSSLCLINFPIKNSYKIIPYYNQLLSETKDEILRKIFDSTGVEIRVIDLLGKLIICSVDLLNYTNVLVVNTEGLNSDSVLFYDKILLGYMQSIDNKGIIYRNNILHGEERLILTNA